MSDQAPAPILAAEALAAMNEKLLASENMSELARIGLSLLASHRALSAEVARLADAERVAWALIGHEICNPRRIPFLFFSCRCPHPPYTEFPTNRWMLYTAKSIEILPVGDVPIFTDEHRAMIDAARGASDA